MSKTFRSKAREELLSLGVYAPIDPVEVTAAHLGISEEELVKLDANESPFGTPEEAMEAIARYPYHHIYPDPQQRHLRQALAQFLGEDEGMILAASGADELIDMLCRVLLLPENVMVVAPPTFAMYGISACLAGARVVEVQRGEDFRPDIEAILKAIKKWRPKLLFLASPNNPTGDWISDEELLSLLGADVFLVLDEAYVEFSGRPSRASWVKEHENLAVLRTMSKCAGLAGLRLGYGVFPAWLMPYLWRVKPPYNVNSAAQAAALAILDHWEKTEERINRLIASRQSLFSALLSFDGIKPLPSQANFILCKTEIEAAALKSSLARQGVLVRTYDNPRLARHFRVSVGREQDHARVLSALRQALA